MKTSVLSLLINDLRSPPAGFPRFDFNYNFFIDEDGKTYGDVTAYVACRALGHPNRIPQFLIDGGDLYDLFKKKTGLSTPDAARLVYPGELVNSRYDLSRMTGDHMATIIQMFMDAGPAFDYKLILRALAELEDESSVHAARYTEGAINARVTGFIDYYGDKTKVW